MKHGRSFGARSTVAVLAAALVLGALALAGTRGAGSGAREADADAAPLPAPTTAPSASPTSSASPSPVRSRIVIQGAGDVSLDPSYLPVFRERGYAWAWSGLGGTFLRDDLTVVNLECPVTPISAPIEKEFNFRCDPAALGAMRDAGVEVANQANNHAFDQGPVGLMDSLRWIRAAGMSAVGAGANAREAIRPALFDIGGWRVAVVGIGEVLDPLWQTATSDSPGTAAGHDLDAALRGIRAAARVADIVVVVIHWGVELDIRPRAYQVEEARQMVAAGADVIFGHHAHRLQPLEFVEGKPVFYGLGNFVWPRFSSDGARTAVARVVVLPDGTLEAELVPVEIVSEGHPMPA